jgi:4-amino-4-deoxy-L-arabinose transferase-like glycosyltransferase
MNTDESLRDRDEDAAPADSAEAAAAPSWWHRDHPIFSALSGFFTGLLVVIVVPGAFAALLGVFFDYDTAEELFPLVLITFALPIGLMVSGRTRRFGRYMLMGMLATAAVVLAVGALVVWVLIMRDG